MLREETCSFCKTKIYEVYYKGKIEVCEIKSTEDNSAFWYEPHSCWCDAEEEKKDDAKNA